MLFCSQLFLVFFLAVFVLSWALPWHRARVWLLLVASYCFYASWNQWLALLIFATTLMDYLVALGMNKTSSCGARRGLLIVSLVVNLGMLGYFKYANFGVDTLNSILQSWGFEKVYWTRVILPAGISFYTFKTMSYTIDVYRGTAPAVRSRLTTPKRISRTRIRSGM